MRKGIGAKTCKNSNLYFLNKPIRCKINSRFLARERKKPHFLTEEQIISPK